MEEILVSLGKLYNGLEFEKYQEKALKVWKDYIDEKIREFYSEDREIDGDDYEDDITIVENNDENDSENESSYILSYEGGEMTNGFLSTSEKFEHGFYCNELKLEYNWGEDGDIICFLPVFGTFKNSNEKFFIINYPEKFEEFEFLNGTGSIEEGEIDKICEVLSKFHIVDYKDLQRHDDGKIHSNLMEK